jgi:hypothetical protein
MERGVLCTPLSNAGKDFHQAFPTLFLPLPHSRCGLWKRLRCGGEGADSSALTLRTHPRPEAMIDPRLEERR